MTTAQLFDVVAARYPDRLLVATDNQTKTYAQIEQQSIRIAAGLRVSGIRSGDHVAVDLANFPEAVVMKLAVARLGAVSVSINFLLRHTELGYVLRQSDAKALVTMDRFRSLDYLDALDRIAPQWETHGGGTALPELRDIFIVGVNGQPPDRGRPFDDLVQLGIGVSDDEIRRVTASVDPSSVSDLLYTSGTTGKPKGAMLHHDGVVRTAYSCALTRAFADARRVGFALPLYHVFGYIEGLLAVLFVGGAIYVQAAFDAERLVQAVDTFQLEELICVPAMTHVVLDAARHSTSDLSSLSTMFSSGAAHPPAMWDEMVEVFDVEELFTAYGQTETTASTMCTQPGDPLDRLKRTNGCPKPAGIAGDPKLDGVLAVYRVVDPATGEEVPVGHVGELLVRGPIVTSGYYNKPEETDAVFDPGGWFHTGDLGHIDCQGYLTLTGRLKESYRCGGEVVMPLEVEEILNGHPSVAASYVAGIPHDRLGEVGCAWVVPTAGESPDPQDLIDYCTKQVARFKVPAKIVFATEDQIPRTVTGRVQKFELVRRLSVEGFGPGEQS